MASSSTRLYEEVQNNSEALVMAHLGMVKRVALHLKVRLPPFMELDELIQVGMIGLLEAARAYNPSKGIEFENFAHSRVRGAILDEVRRLSFLPRSAVAINKSGPLPRPNWPTTWARTLISSIKNEPKRGALKRTPWKW